MPSTASIPFVPGETAADPVAAPAGIERKYFVRLLSDNGGGANMLFGLSAGGGARFRLYLTSIPVTEALPADEVLRDPAKVQYFVFPEDPEEKDIEPNEVALLLNRFIPGWYYVRLRISEDEGVLRMITGSGVPTPIAAP